MKGSKVICKMNEANMNDKDWIEEELKGSHFKDERLKKRFKTLCYQLWSGVGQPIPFACEDWAGTKAAYRFFSNKRFSEKEILKGHFESTKMRFSQEKGPILILHDTTEFSYERDKKELVGFIGTSIIPAVKDIHGKYKRHTQCGLLMHSSLAVTTGGCRP